MISASVMGLARLLHEFAPLADCLPDLLPAMLMLLRSKAREIIKSVLGFLKVGQHQPQIDRSKSKRKTVLINIGCEIDDNHNSVI